MQNSHNFKLYMESKLYRCSRYGVRSETDLTFPRSINNSVGKVERRRYKHTAE